MIVYSAFTKPGDTVATISIASGAHVSMAGAAPKKVFGLNVVELPYNQEKFNIDVIESVKLLKTTKPKMLILGGSVLLFKQPVKELVETCKKTGTIVLFDAAHVAGLIAVGYYPNPLDDGADIMTMSLCKTIPGPQHALILSSEKYADKIKNTSFPGFVSSHHLHETVAGVLTLEEFKVFGEGYSKQVLINCKELAKCLSGHGFNVVAKEMGFTETHMCLLDISSTHLADKAEKLLEDSNIIVNRNLLPHDLSVYKCSGLRLGTPEMTRIGAKKKDMAIIAGFFKDILIDGKSPEKVRKKIVEFRKSFKDLHYSFNKLQ